MNDICATIGLENFKDLEKILKKHRDNAAFYDKIFEKNGITVAKELPRAKSSYWLYTLHVSNRDELMAKLKENGVMASKVHARNDTHSIFKDFKVHLPNVDKFNDTHLCIPVGWWVTKTDRKRIAKLVLKYGKKL